MRPDFDAFEERMLRSGFGSLLGARLEHVEDGFCRVRLPYKDTLSRGDELVHGGVIAGLFDEILAAGQGLTGERPGVTGRLVVRYRRITPIDTDLVFRSWVERDRGLRLDMRAECVVAATLDDDQPTRTADAEAFFVRRR